MAKKKADNIKAKLMEAKEKIADLEARFEDRISEHPLQSIAISFGVGFVSGAIIMALARRK